MQIKAGQWLKKKHKQKNKSDKPDRRSNMEKIKQKD